MKYLPLVWRNLGRNPLRSVLTAAAIALAIALVCILRTMPAGLDAILASAAANTRISTHNEAGIVYSMPYSYLAKVRAVPGVVAAISWNWFGGALDLTKGVEFPNFAVDPDGFAEVYADWGLEPKVLEDFRKYRDAALVARQTLEKHRWKVGDVITLQSTVFPVTLSFRIVGANPNQGGALYFQREYLEQALAGAGVQFDTTGMIWSRVDDPERVAPVMRQIDEMFRNSEAITSTETEKSFIGNFFGGLKQLVMIIQIVAALVTLCIVFIAANTASMSIRERVGEIAILKAIGFRKQTIFSTLLAEAGLLALVAGIFGAVAAFGMLKALQLYATGAGPQLGPLTAFAVSNAILVQAIFIAFFIGILSGWVPALGASRRSVAQTLREVF
ncbi:MAG TPA: ABC transporter permease [Myxococcota bacterium]|nr:ABC transporter permease [Myxococcota bacterium]